MHTRNNFDAIRLLAALLVVAGHSWALKGQADPRVLGAPASYLGVCIFFIISGYLVTDSWQRDPRALPFFLKRSLRIFPALAVVVVASTFVLGPLITQLSIAQYLSSPVLVEYLRCIALYISFNLPGTFVANPVPNAVNGSLWSLPVEFACYVTVPLAAYVIRAPERRALAVGVLGAIGGLLSVYVWAYGLNIRFIFYATDWISAPFVMVYFFAGACIRLLGDKIPLRIDVAIAGLVAITALYAFTGKFIPPIYWFVLSYAIITFGHASFPITRNAAQYGDFSYGVYLYAFPVQQTVIQYCPWANPLVVFALASIASLALAALSWHLIEHPALRLKGVVVASPSLTQAT